MKPDCNDLKERIQSLLSAPRYQPLRPMEIIAALKIPPHQRGNARAQLDRMQQKGEVVRVRKDRLVLPSQANLVTGKITMHPNGFGFVTPENPTEPGDIFIPPDDTWVGMHGDRVVIRVEQEPPGRFPRPQARSHKGGRRIGRVIRILERAHPSITGILKKSGQFLHVIPDDPRFLRDIYVQMPKGNLKPRVGDRVVVKLSPWENRHVNPEGAIIEVMGQADNPGHDIPVIIRKFKFRTDFPPAVTRQAESILEEIPDEERARREDFTKTLVVTIDPDDARDHDDALSVEQLPNGRWRLTVHIADVSHYVRPGSPLDQESRERGNSVYLPDRVIPMLPPELSNGICSLKENVERLTQSVVFEISPSGEVLSWRFFDGIIRSVARLTYGQVLPVIEPRADRKVEIADASICALLRDLWSVASKLRQRRFAAGSLDLDFPELKVYCRPDGIPDRIEKQENDISHQLVEECMLLANEAVAAEIRRCTIPGIYRIHEDPEPERLEEYRDMVIASGFTMGDPTQRAEIQRLLKSLNGKAEEYILKLHLLRSLKRAQYSTNPLGHYGLAKANYTHFTSPIRRYADLVIHRTLIHATRKSRNPFPGRTTPAMAYDLNTLETVCHHCSTTERTADEAEKEAVKLKLIEFFERKMKEQDSDSFAAVITEVRNFGMFVELPEFMLSGMVHVSTLDDDFYRYDVTRQRLIGKRTKKVLAAGARVRVSVARVDRYKKQVDFKLTEE